MSSSKRVLLYVTPVLIVSFALNIPKFLETQVRALQKSFTESHSLRQSGFRIEIKCGAIDPHVIGLNVGAECSKSSRSPALFITKPTQNVQKDNFTYWRIRHMAIQVS